MLPSIAVQRIRLLHEKKEAQAKTARRDIASLLEQRKIEKARVKVESSEYHFHALVQTRCIIVPTRNALELIVINDDVYIELLELLELYCELLLARFGLLEQK